MIVRDVIQTQLGLVAEGVLSLEEPRRLRMVRRALDSTGYACSKTSVRGISGPLLQPPRSASVATRLANSRVWDTEAMVGQPVGEAYRTLVVASEGGTKVQYKASRAAANLHD